MAFDISTAKPISNKFDISTAKPVKSGFDMSTAKPINSKFDISTAKPIDTSITQPQVLSQYQGYKPIPIDVGMSLSENERKQKETNILSNIKNISLILQSKPPQTQQDIQEFSNLRTELIRNLSLLNPKQNPLQTVQQIKDVETRKALNMVVGFMAIPEGKDFISKFIEKQIGKGVEKKAVEEFGKTISPIKIEPYKGILKSVETQPSKVVVPRKVVVPQQKIENIIIETIAPLKKEPGELLTQSEMFYAKRVLTATEQPKSIINEISKIKVPTINEKLIIPDKEFTDYQNMIYKEIVDNPMIQKFEPAIKEHIPPTISENNFFTNKIRNFLQIAWKKASEVPVLNKGMEIVAPSGNRGTEGLAILKERMRLNDGINQRLQEEIVSPLQKFTPEQKRDIGLQLMKYKPVTDQYKGIIKNVDLEIGKLSKHISDINKEWLDKGWITPDKQYLAEETMKQNIGEYLRSFYVRPKNIIKPTVFTQPTGISGSMFKNKLSLLDWGRKSLEFEGKTSEEINSMLPKEIEKIGLEAKINYGWVNEADYMVDLTAKQMTKNVANMEYLNYIRKSPTLFSVQPKQGFAPITKLITNGSYDRKLGPLNGGYINEGLLEDLKMMINPKKDLIDTIWGEALGGWKSMKTALAPGAIARNYWSGNLIQTDMAGYNVFTPRNMPTYIDSFKQYLTKGDRYKFWRDSGLYGSDFSTVEIPTNIIADINDIDKLGSKLFQFTRNIKSKLGYYQATDHIARTYLAESAFKNGSSVQEAVKFANKWQLDYRLVPPLVDKLRKNGIGGLITPFLSYYYLMTPRVVETALTKPWVIAKYTIGAYAFEETLRNRLGLSKEELENKKPAFMKGGFNFLIGGTKQNPEFMDLSFILPFGKNPFTAFMDLPEIAKLVAGGGPISILQNVINNYDPFFKKPIYDRNESPFSGKAMAYVAKGLGPGVVNDIERVYRSARGGGYPIQRERRLPEALLRIAGISLYSGGINEIKRKENEIKKDIMDYQIDKNQLKSNRNISNENKSKQLKEIMINIEKKKREKMMLHR